jgi:gliding motility-associated-like protein
VKDANGCTQSTIAILKSPNAPTINQISYDDIPCYGGVSGGIQIQASGIVSVVDYQVQPGNLNQASSLFPGQAAGSYTVTITDANLCTATSIFQVTQPQPIVFTETNFIPDSCGSNFIGTLRCQANGGTGNILYRVEPLNQNNSAGIFQLIESGVYKITATDVNGCQTNSSIEVKERICCDQVFVPNAFSPNGDGLNDELKVLNLSGVEFKDMMVYNKWGNQVFLTQNAEFGWNGNYKGSPAETGTYFYLVRYKCRGSGQMYTLKGDCILLR